MVLNQLGPLVGPFDQAHVPDDEAAALLEQVLGCNLWINSNLEVLTSNTKEVQF